ncbi:MAG: helix-turn-helix domain-containing protein [Candidatus Thermoplasmatota archaeon]|jgi:predicted transcriptional regulator|nr:helix-turn-helix domain-containing protein [Candidatus Thermoplasmatota archaeon]MCL5789260.1 helix-turn-helix domain-containing protein [Candidatus Thermoplasmatota archaeon]
MSTDLLDLIDNDIRRRILSILSIRPSYTFELARSLGSSQQLIAKHIRLLEESGLVFKVGKIESDEGPPRILYKANLPLLSLLQFIESISVFDSEEAETENIEGSLQDLIGQLKDIDGKIRVLEDNLKELISAKQSVLLAINRMLLDTDTSLFYRMIREALENGNFDLLFDAINRHTQ